MQKALHSQSPVVNIFIAEANHMNCQLVATAFRRKRYRVAVVGSAVNSSLAISLVKEREPDVAVVSAQLEAGPLEGFGVVRDMRALQSRTRAVMLLASRERELVVGAFRCGAHGVIFRDEPFETLCKCIHAVHRGQVWANSEHLGYVLQALTPTVPLHLQDSNGVALLSKREEEVVRLVAEGMTNKQISSHLRLSEHTIRNYLFHVFDKLGISTRVELVLYCLQERQKDSAPAFVLQA
jgi:DNA-binding NarL/FixJ family response regulator